MSRFEKADKNTWLRIVVTEGRPHLIKRLCAAIGHPVVRLFRPSHAGIPVDGLKPGHIRELTSEEVKRIHQISEGKGSADPALKLPPRRHGHGIGKDEPEEEAPEPPRRAEGGPRQRADRRERETPTRS